MGSIEGVIILSPTNEPILHSHFLHPLPNYPIIHIDQLAARLEAAPSNEDALPVFYTDGIPNIPEEDDDEGEQSEDESGDSKDVGQTGSALVQIQHNRLRLVATFSKHGAYERAVEHVNVTDEALTVDPLLPLSFLNNLLSILELYLGTPLTEEAIRENFDIVYQLMEEMLDESGHPLNTEYNSLRDIVREPSWVNNVMGKMASMPGLGSSATPAHISNIPWRRPLQATQRTTRNEIYVDVVETIQGSFSRGSHPYALPNLHLQGAIECNSKLGGTPDLSLKLNNTSSVVGLSLHPCVRVKRWKKEAVFSFVPPDGQFTLAAFDVQGVTSLEKQVPIFIHCSREERSGKEASTFRIEVGANGSVEGLTVSFKTREEGCTIETNVTGGSRSGVMTGEDINTVKGSVHHDTKSGLVRWTIDRLESTQKPLILSGTIKSDTAPHLSSAVCCQFTVPLKSASGLKVASLDIVNEVGYRPFKGVRNLLKGDLDWRW